MSGDPERDDPNARTKAPGGAPAGVLGGPGKRPESAPVETGNRVPKSVFAHTIAGIPGSVSLPAPTEADKPPRSTSDAAEPLRDPSDRPAPAPHKREQGAWGGTLPMPEAGSPGNRSAERMIAAKPGIAGERAESSPVQVHGAAKVGTPGAGGRGEPTVRMPTTAASVLAQSSRPAPAAKAPLPAAPPPSGSPPAMPPAQSASPKSPASAAPAKREESSIPRLSLGVEKIPSQEPATKLEFTGQSQPLQLSLDARDHVEASLRPVAAQPKSMLPWITIALVVVLGGLAFALTRGGDEPAPPVERVDAVPALDPVVPSAEAPLPSTAPVAPAAPSAPAAPAVVAPTPKPSAPVAKADAVEEKEKAKPAAKPKARKTKKPAASKPSGPVLKVTPEGESDLEAAMRAAERLKEPEDDLAPPEPPSAEPPSPDEE
jgi:hypothetical protein